MPVVDAGAARQMSWVLGSILGLALLVPAVSAQAQDGMTATRVALPAVLRHGASQVALKPGAKAGSGDLIKSGHGGRVEIREGGNTVRLGESAEFYIHEMHAGQLKAVLVHGAAHLITSGNRPLDMRINVGRLRLKLSGADVWAEQASDGETVCLLAGVVDVQSDLAPPRAMNVPGQCLFVDRLGDPLLIKADRQGTLARKLAQTGFGSDEPEAPVEVARPRTIQPLAARPAEPVEPPAARASAPASGWTVVLASHKESALAQRHAQQFSAAGVAAEVREQRSDRGTMFRVVTGVHPDEAQARARLQQLRKRYPDAWLTRY